MEYWGVEVRPGEPLKCNPGFCRLIHVSQAAIGEVKNVEEAKNVKLRVTVGGKSYVIGTLSAEDRPQLMFDLVFEQPFELSHDWKNGSVYFMGYEASDPCSEPASDSEESSEDEENALNASEEDSEDEDNVLDAPVKKEANGKVEEIKADLKDVKIEAKKAAPVPSKTAAPLKPASSTVAEEAESDEDDSEDDSDDEDSSDDPEEDDDSDDVPVGMDFSSDEDDDDSEEDDSEEETPKKFEQKKRPAPTAKGTPASAKKAKQATPEKTGGKKSPATPASGKQSGKAAGNGNNPKAQTPKSGGQFSGKSSGGKFSGKSSGGKNFSAQQKGNKGKHGKK